MGELQVALVGNPNSGKTTLFNALTGLHQHVANYPGVTVEKKEGLLRFDGRLFRIIDLPGTYSLSAASEDEQVVRDVLLGLRRQKVDLVVVVLDASHLERQLFLATQIMELGLPLVVALTMNDEARRHQRGINVGLLSRRLAGVPVCEVIASRNRGVNELRQLLSRGAVRPSTLPWRAGSAAFAQDANIVQDTQLRYSWIRDVVHSSTTGPGRSHEVTRSDRVDRVLVHPVAGLLIFAVVMALVFQAIFTWAVPLMSLIETGAHWLGSTVASWLPVGPLRGLIVDGVIGGVGAVLVFIPQILLLFFFIALLEDSGYMSRAAFLMNSHMRRVGLQGKAFIPMLCGFACAIPAIMATRTIGDKRDRLITMLVVPLMSCSARLPVYALMIAAFVPPLRIAGGFTAQGATLLGAYLLSLIAALSFAALFRRTILKGEPQPFILELPPYRIPHWRSVLTVMWERGRLFVTQAGTIILAINIVLWFLVSFPQAEPALAAAGAQVTEEGVTRQLHDSYVGRLGHMIEPAIRPLGFDWKIGIGLIGSFAAREVFVSTMAIVYNAQNAGDAPVTLMEAMQQDIDPRTGKPVFNLLVSINLILFYILACQCMSTLAVVKRETGGWRWPLFMFGYMTLLAYVVCLLVYQIGSRIWRL